MSQTFAATPLSSRKASSFAGRQSDGHASLRKRTTDKVFQPSESSGAGADDALAVGLPSGAIQIAHRRTFARDPDDRLPDVGLNERSGPRRRPFVAVRPSVCRDAKSFNGIIKVLSVIGDRFWSR